MAQTTTTRRIAISAIAVTGLISGCSSTTLGSGTLGGPGAPTSGSASTPHLDKKWQRRVGGGPGSNTQLTGGSADAARIYVNDVSGDVYALAASSGAVQWHARPGTRTGSAVSVDGGVVLYYVSNFHTAVLDPATGRVLWSRQTPTAARSTSTTPLTRTACYTPAQIGHTLVYPTLKGLRGISLKDGSTLFTTKVEGSGVTKIGSCGGLACATGLENLVVIGADGKQLAETKTPGGDPDYPILFGAGKTYLYSSSTVYALG